MTALQMRQVAADQVVLLTRAIVADGPKQLVHEVGPVLDAIKDHIVRGVATPKDAAFAATYLYAVLLGYRLSAGERWQQVVEAAEYVKAALERLRDGEVRRHPSPGLRHVVPFSLGVTEAA